MNPQLVVAEPPIAYRQRPRLIVDASVLASALFAESGLAQAVSWMRGRLLCAPHLIDFEIANAALNKGRRRSISGAALNSAMQAFASLDLERHTVDAIEVVDLAARYGLSAYDAAYLWLAANLAAPLATFDAELGAAARRHLAGDVE